MSPNFYLWPRFLSPRFEYPTCYLPLICLMDYSRFTRSKLTHGLTCSLPRLSSWQLHSLFVDSTSLIVQEILWVLPLNYFPIQPLTPHLQRFTLE